MSTAALKSNTSVKDEKFFSSFITNLKLVYNSINNNNSASGSHHANKSVSSNQSLNISPLPTNTNGISNKTNDDLLNEAKVKNKSKFKTIKIFVASNKNEFTYENECLLQEAQPELQQYFMQFGYDFLFVEVNLNHEFDPLLDPFLFECMRKELKEAHETSEACFLLILCGNKYGTTPLPLEITQKEYETVRNTVSNSDFEFFQQWYELDENNVSPCFKLKQMTESFINIYNRNPGQATNDIKRLKEVHQKLMDIFQSSRNETNEAIEKVLNNNKPRKTDNEWRLNHSGVEILTNDPTNYHPHECLLINRIIQGHAEEIKSHNKEKYFDVSDGKLNKNKYEKQKRFREKLATRLGKDNMHEFNVKWNDSYGDIYSIRASKTPDEPPTSTNNADEATTFSWDLNKFDDDFKHYLQSFNTIVVSNIKTLIGRKLHEDSSISNNFIETSIFHEISRHLHKYQDLAECSQIECENYIERFKRLIEYGMSNEHYPIFLYGAMNTGKTTCLIKFGLTAFGILDPKNCVYIVRFSNLTCQSCTFEGLLASICEQMCVILSLDPVKEVKNKDVVQLIQFFNNSCEQITKENNRQLLIIIDGLQDLNVNKSLIKDSLFTNNQISWLFNKMLPAGVHLVVSVKRQISSITVESEDLILKKSNKNDSGDKKDEGVVVQQQNPPVIVSFFINNYNEKIPIDLKENCLFEFPFGIKKSDANEIVVNYCRNELEKNDRTLNEKWLQLIANNCISQSVAQQQNEMTTNINQSTVSNSGNDNDLCQISFLYLNLMIKEVLSANQLNKNLKHLLDEKEFPKDLESIIKFKIAQLESKFNNKMLRIIFNYITASHHGLTEMEIVDLLSCSNDFFIEYYSNTDLPAILRFPIALWLVVKHQLGDLLAQKYLDNKLTLMWGFDCVKKILKQKYFNKVDLIRMCHKDLTNYYLEAFVESKPLVDMAKSIQIRDEEGRRYICHQPLLYSIMRYNFRRMSELWYHLMNSGDIQRLKEHAFFNFEHLLAKCHGMSLQTLLNDLDAVLRRILDTDLLLITSLLKKSLVTLSQDPLRLASEILARLRPLQDDYGEHVTSLVKQATEWCNNHESPVLVPLSTWLGSPENLLITRIDYPDGVLKIAVTSFNQHVFFSTYKHEICMFHVPSKKLVRKFIGHTDVINFLQISYNNRFLISGSADKLIRVWNLGTGEIEISFNCHKSSVLCAVLSHSDEYLITGTYDRLVNVIRIESGDIVHSIEKHFDAITAVAISLDDTILVTASLDKSVKRWSFEDMQVIDTISTIYSPVTSMVITCDNTFVIIGCENRSVQVKSLITGSDIHDLYGHHAAITGMSISSDCQRLYVGCEDSKLYLYDIKSKELVAILIEQESCINDLKISIDNSFLFSSSGNSLYVLNLKKKKFVSKQRLSQMLFDSAKFVQAFAISKEGDLAITGDESGRVTLWNLLDGDALDTIEPVQVNSANTIGACKVALSTSHLFSVIGFTNNTVNVYDNEMGDVVAIFREHQSPVKHLFVLDDNRKILSSDGFNLCKVWQANNGQLLESITVACNHLNLSPDLKYVVSGAGENTLKIWTLEEAKVIRTIDHPEKINLTVFTTDSQYVITGAEDSVCKIWELSTGKLIQVLIEHEGGITSIAVPSNNSLVVTGAKDKQVIVWNFKHGSVNHKLSLHTEVIVKVAITFDGNVVISASRDSTINVWSVRYGYLLTSINLQFKLSDLLVSTNGNRMIARFEDSAAIPIIGLTHKWSTKEYRRTLSETSLKSPDYIIKNEIYNNILPIKPRPLIYPKKTLHLVSLFSNNANGNHASRHRKLSDATSNIQTEAISQSQNSSSRGLLQKQKRKTKRSPDFSSTASMNNIEEKHKKTKICCIL